MPSLGPDAARYWLAGGSQRQARPFHLRWLLPYVCEQSIRRWWVVWIVSWPVAGLGMFAWQAQSVSWVRSLAATVLVLGLPGILGPKVTVPVGVDLPALAVGLSATALVADGSPHMIVAGCLLAAMGSTIRETVPVYAALWAWSPWPLLGLAVPLAAHLVYRPAAEDVLGPKFTQIARHPVRASLEAHRGRWRDGWLWVAPWGVCLAGLLHPTPQVLVALAASWAVVLVATDTVRLQHHAAGPVLAASAAQIIPVSWMLIACAVHVFWFRTPERV